jgi:broad specificity phosphatase PhoE
MNKPMRLILVRHGETLWNAIHRFQGFSDIELSPNGISQAESLALALQGEPLSAIYCSPLTRARRTAEIVARFHTCETSVEEGLKELNQGRLEGLTGEEMRRDFPEFLEKWLKDPGSVSLPGGECLDELQKRAWQVIDKITGRHLGETVLAVAHSFVNIVIVCRVLGIPLTQFRRLRQDATGKNIIEFTRGGAILRCLNDTCHIQPESHDGGA